MREKSDAADRGNPETAPQNLNSPMQSWPSVQLAGLPITNADRDTVANGFIQHALLSRGRTQPPFYSTSANGQVIAMCGENEALREEFLKADQILADGMPMVFGSKLKHKTPLQERVATTDLFHDVAERAIKCDVSFYLLGADEGSLQKAIDNVSDQYPELKIAGYRNGYFSEDEEAEIVQQVNATAPDILWVAMGVPREQEFLARNLEKLSNVGVVKTSGGLFDFLSHKRSRAPGWMQAIGFEWLYRALLEPWRLGPRYLATNPIALYRILFT